MTDYTPVYAAHISWPGPDQPAARIEWGADRIHHLGGGTSQREGGCPKMIEFA